MEQLSQAVSKNMLTTAMGLAKVGDRRRFVGISLLLVAVGALLRFYHLGTEELWLDESFSAHMVATDWTWTAILEENTPPLYYALLKLWSLAAGDSEFALRSLSAFSGSLFVLATIWLGKEVFNEAVGLWSGFFVSINPLAIYYSQEARVYALLLLLLTLTFVNLWLAVKTGGFKNWFSCTLCGILALYAHYLAALALAPTLVLLLACPAGARQAWRNYAIVILVWTLTCGPWFAAKFLYEGQQVGTDWLAGLWVRGTPSLLIPQSLEVFGLGSQRDGVTLIRMKQMTVLSMPTWLRAAGLALLAVLAVAATVSWEDRTLGVSWPGRRKVWLVSLLCLPLLLLLGVSLAQPVYLVGRYDLIGFPAFPILLGLGAAKLQRMARFGPWIAYATVLGLLAVMGAKLFLYYNTSRLAHRANARATASFLSTHVANGDAVVFTSLRGASVLYYLRRLGYNWTAGRCIHENGMRNFGCRMFPRETESHIAAYEPVRSREQIFLEAKSLLRDLRDEHGSFWIAFRSRRSEGGTFVPVGGDNVLIRDLAYAGYANVRAHEGLLILEVTRPSPP